MKIYNQEKTQILENPDLEKGYLMPDQIVIKTIPANEEVQEQFHYEYKHYDNGGSSRKKIVDIEYQPAKPESYEYEDIQIYVPYTEKEYADVRINKLTKQLEATDYIANKLIEAETDEERQQLRIHYATQLTNRKQWRKEVSDLQDKLKRLEQEVANGN